VGVLGQAHQGEVALGDLSLFRRRQPLQERPELDVLPGRPPGEEHVLLEHDAPVSPGPGDRLAVDEDAPARRGDEARDHAQERGLATPARSEQTDEVLVAHLERQVVDRDHRPLPRDVDLAHPFGLHLGDHGRRRHGPERR
jgi:hypothetical protein